jgi:hypothetical protein
VSEPRPSVIESPTSANVAVVFGTHACTAERKYQCAALCVLGPVIFCASTWFPNVNQDVVRLPGCEVMDGLAWPCAV